MRYGFTVVGQRVIGGDSPFVTLGVNLSGSLIAGLLLGIFETVAVSADLRAAIFVGALGAYTTFSTFTVENFALIRKGQYALCFWNMTLSLVLGTCAVFVGYGLSRLLHFDTPTR